MNIVIEGMRNTTSMSGIERYTGELVRHISAIGEGNDQISLVSPIAQNGFPNAKLTKKIPVYGSVDIYHRTFPAQSTRDIFEFFLPQKCIFTPLDLIPFKHPGYFRSKERYDAYCRWMRYALNFSDKIIAISEHGKKDIIDNFQIEPEKVKVTYLGVDTDRFKKIQDSRAIEDFRQQFSLPDKYIFFLASDYPYKNIVTLLKAFEKLSRNEQFKGYSLVCAGNSFYREGQKHFQEALRPIKNRIKMLGYVKDEILPMLYNGASLFVHPSLYEGFGFPILEAMACGTPVVCSNATSVPEIAGNAAMVVDAGNAESLAAGIAGVLFNPEIRKDLVNKGFQRVKLFRWDDCARKTYNIYKDELQKPRQDTSRVQMREFAQSVLEPQFIGEEPLGQLFTDTGDGIDEVGSIIKIVFSTIIYLIKRKIKVYLLKLNNFKRKS